MGCLRVFARKIAAEVQWSFEALDQPDVIQSEGPSDKDEQSIEGDRSEFMPKASICICMSTVI